MDIYVVQPNDNIYSIANQFGVSADKLIRDNELGSPNQLITGQTLVIVYPEQTYTVQEGDTLQSIATTYDVSILQLLRNNPFLSNRAPYPGEIIPLSYNTNGNLTINGFVYPYIDIYTLKKTLPSLTYISIYNYRVINDGGLISYWDDSEIINTSMNYSTIPLMMVSVLSPQGEPDLETAYKLLLNTEYQDNLIHNMINFIKTKGYYGINFVIQFSNEITQNLEFNFITRISSRLKSEGYLFFVTFNPNTKYVDNKLIIEKIDYNSISQLVDGITFLQFVFGTNYGQPKPINSIEDMRTIIDYAVTTIPSEKILLGNSLISYDWELPYIPGKSYANALSIKSALNLARESSVPIQFDEASQSPFFNYNQLNYGEQIQHIVWSIDARSIESLMKLIFEYLLNGAAFWNIMIYYSELWLVINSQFEIEKLIPENIQI